jgi:lysophospholipase L1-like esterase
MQFKYLPFLLIILNISVLSSKKLNLRHTDSCLDYTYLPTKENVKLIGRYYQTEEGITWLTYSGSAIEFYATGNYIELNLAGDDNILQEYDFRPRYGIYLDDKLLIDTKMNDYEFTLQFKISNDELSQSKIKIMLLSENQNGGVGIKNIKVNSCYQKVKKISPTGKKQLRIEFIGDSITCAYGVDAPDQSYSFTTTTENFSKSYAYLVAQILEADYSVMALSGHGIVSGFSGGDKWAEGLIPLYYGKNSRNVQYPGFWDFKSHENDFIVINLGTNDANYVNAKREERANEFVQEYANFLQMVREANPLSFIICTLGTLNPLNMYPLVEEAVKLFGDEKVYVFESPVQDMNDGLGADWHPSKITHEKLALLVSEKIKEVLNDGKVGKN